MGKPSALLVVRQMLIKMTMRYPFTLIKTVKNLFQVITASVLNGAVKRLSHTLLLGGNETE